MDKTKLDKIVEQARKAADERQKGYREQSLKIHPWVCARCGRAFTRKNLHELTVHHIDHNHDNNPSDGSNWENLCLYCHDQEHQKFEAEIAGYSNMKNNAPKPATYNPFADLKDKMNKESKD